MLKKDEWYFIPDKNNYETKSVGRILKILDLEDNTLYAKTEQWGVSKDRKFEKLGLYEQTDTVYIEKYGTKISSPPKFFEILFSESVNKKVDNV